MLQLVKVMMPDPVNLYFGFKVEEAVIQVRVTISKWPAKSQQILQNTKFKKLLTAFVFAIISSFFAESIILQYWIPEWLFYDFIFFNREVPVYIWEGRRQTLI